MSVMKRRLEKLERATTPPGGVCPHLPYLVESDDAGDGWRSQADREGRARRDALTCGCGRERGRIRIVWEQNGRGGPENDEEAGAIRLRWPD